MSTKPSKSSIKIVPDSNILISAILYGGNPEKVLRSIISKRIIGITSDKLLTEFSQKMLLKFDYPPVELKIIISKLKISLRMVKPTTTLDILKDDPDNRVLETAIAGKANYIVTGDKKFLELKKYKDIKIISPKEFVDLELENK